MNVLNLIQNCEGKEIKNRKNLAFCYVKTQFYKIQKLINIQINIIFNQNLF